MKWLRTCWMFECRRNHISARTVARMREGRLTRLGLPVDAHCVSGNARHQPNLFTFLNCRRWASCQTHRISSKMHQNVKFPNEKNSAQAASQLSQDLQRFALNSGQFRFLRAPPQCFNFYGTIDQRRTRFTVQNEQTRHRECTGNESEFFKLNRFVLCACVRVDWKHNETRASVKLYSGDWLIFCSICVFL